MIVLLVQCWMKIFTLSASEHDASDARDARDAKGTQRRGGRRGRRACVMHEMITLPLVVSFGIALIFKSNKETAKR